MSKKNKVVTWNQLEKRISKLNSKTKARQNSASSLDLLNGVFSFSGGAVNPLSTPTELTLNNSYTPLTLNRVVLSYAYMTHGILQTVADQQIEDAFRGGLIIKSDELDMDDINDLQDYLEQCGTIKEVKSALRWAKVFGGAGLIINTDQDPMTPLDIEALGENKPLSFLSADRWELTLNYLQTDQIECPYNYYGQSLHKTRVIKIMGKEAPSFIRRKLQGWGMSEYERMIRSINAGLKNEDVAYELMDEAKIDVWKIKGFNRNIITGLAKGIMNDRLTLASMLKNYFNAIAMDTEDEYEQKQISFSGLPEMLNQNRIGMAAAVRMPMAKLFGLSAAGFNSGEDDIENYNALIESEVRAKAREVLLEVLPLCCQQMFGFIPKIKFEFKPLRVLSAAEEEVIKSQKFNRYSALFAQGMLNGQEYADILKAEGLQTFETEVGKGLREPEPPAGGSTDFDVPQKMVKEKAGAGA